MTDFPAFTRRALLGAGAFAALPAWSEERFPSKPIRLVVPYPPGGTTDLQARAISLKMQQLSNITVVVENKAGAGGNIGVDTVLKAPPDGYTLGITAMNSFAINPLLTKKLPYDVTRDVQPVTLVGSVPNLLVTHPGTSLRTLKDVAAAAAAGDVTFASPGAGTSVHLSAEMVADALKIKLRHIPYRGDAPALQDVMGGRVPLMMGNLPGVIEQVRGGKLRPIAITSPRRSPLLPDVPTVAETVPGFDVRAYFNIFTARGVPAPVLETLNRELSKALSHPEVRAQFVKLGIDVAPSSVEALTALIYLESRKWAPIVAKTGATWD